MPLFMILQDLTPLILGALGIVTVGQIKLAKIRTREPERREPDRELSALRERVQVLERALTDPSERLDRQIEDLRR